jgi:hypothetical protein
MLLGLKSNRERILNPSVETDGNSRVKRMLIINHFMISNEAKFSSIATGFIVSPRTNRCKKSRKINCKKLLDDPKGTPRFRENNIVWILGFRTDSLTHGTHGLPNPGIVLKETLFSFTILFNCITFIFANNLYSQ